MAKSLFKRSIASVALAASLFAFVPAFVAQAVTFSDVNNSTDYKAAILWAQSVGFVSGYPDGTFKPDACVKRAELLKMIYAYNAPGSLNVTTNKAFSDVHSSDWFYKYVNRAVYDGVVKGYDDGTFKPGNCVNRAEAMKIATNALFYMPDLSDFGGVVYYDDKLVVDIHNWDWFAPYSNFLFRKRLVGTNHTVSNGYVSGIPTIKFSPDGFMSRKEVAQLIYNYDEYILNHPVKPPVTPTPTPNSPLVAPTLFTPSNGTDYYNGYYNNGSSVFLSWNPVMNATKYEITLTSSANGYSKYVYNVNSGTTSYYVPSNNLPPNNPGTTVNFAWNVRAYDSNNNYKDSATWTFRNIGQLIIEPPVALGTPTLTAPANNAVIQSGILRQTTLQWTPVSGAATYQVEYGCDWCGGGAKWSNPTTYTTDGTSQSISAAGDNDLRFRVRAVSNKGVTGSWSGYNYFKFNSSAVTALVSPSSGTNFTYVNGVPPLVTTLWTAATGATHYDLMVRFHNSRDYTVYQLGNVLTYPIPTKDIPPFELGCMSESWKVRAYQSNGTYQDSSEWSFMVCGVPLIT